MWWSILLACAPAPHDHAGHEPHDHEAHAPSAAPAAPADEALGDGAPHGEHRHEGSAHHRFDDAAKWSEVFDDPERDAWQKPADVVAAMALSPGMTAADIGAGTGYFNPHLAAAVGPTGKVLALDIEPNLIAHMTARAERDGTPQVEARLGTPDDAGLKPAEADRVLIVDTYHHIQTRPAYFAKVRAGVKPGGKLIVVDFKKEDSPMGPPVAERIAPDVVQAELIEAGWVFERAVDGWPYQYVLVFAAP